LGLLSRVNSRMKDEGFAKTVEYGVRVGVDTLSTWFGDAYLDLKYSGRLLHGNSPSRFSACGANDVYHTDYGVMPLIFANAPVGKDDVLVDVGCGKGRVINFWLSRNIRNPIIGLEIDPGIAARTARQFARWPNVRIIPGDAVELLPPEGTLLYFYNPFNERKVIEFERKVRAAGNDVQVVYYNPKSLSAFDNGHWAVRVVDFARDMGVKRWGRLNKYHNLAVITRK